MLRRCFVGLLALVSTALAAEIRLVEQIVVKVNNDIITQTELARKRQTMEAELRQQGLKGGQLDKALEEKEKDSLRDQIDQLLLVQRGKDLNINVDSEVTKRLAQIQLQSKITDPDKFHEWLREQSDGMSFEDIRAQLRNQIMTQRVIGQEVGSKIAVPRAEVEKYYEEHKKEFVRDEQIFMRQILISTEGKSADQVVAAEKKAKEIVARARKGEKFGELARDYSDDVETAKGGGEMPAFKKGQLRKEIEDVVFKAKRGFVTDPIRMANGFLILKVEERYEAGQAIISDVENEITEQLYNPRMMPKLRDYLTKLRLEAFLEIRGGFVDSGAAPGKDTAWKDPAQLKPETTTKEEVAARKKRKFLGVPMPGKTKASSADSKPAPATPAVTPVPPAPAPAPQ
jgi:peptidyl-prolyl cis-trans isomerase SurA